MPPKTVLLPLGVAICLSLFGDLTLYAVLASQADVVGITLAGVGVMLGVNRLIRIPFNPAAGVLFDRFGRRRLFILGMAIGTAAVTGFGLARGFWPFLLTRLGWGIAWTLLNVGGMTMVLDVSSASNRGRLVGIYNIFVLLGLALGPLVGGFLVDGLGFQRAMFICAGLIGIGLVVALVALPETRCSTQPTAAQPMAPPQDRAPHGGWLRRTGTILRHNRPLLTSYVLYLITQLAGEGIVLSTVNLLLQQHFGETVPLGVLTLGVASASGLLLGMRSILAGVIGPMAGHLSDARRGRRPIIAGAMVLGVVSFSLLAFTSTLPGITLGVILSAISGGAALTALAAQVGDQTPRGTEGAAMGVYATAGDIGSTAGPFLAFALVPLVGLRWVYLVCAVVFVGGMALMMVERKGTAS